MKEPNGQVLKGIDGVLLSQGELAVEAEKQRVATEATNAIIKTKQTLQDVTVGNAAQRTQAAIDQKALDAEAMKRIEAENLARNVAKSKPKFKWPWQS